jgi:glycosylphosphatidylinositol transamidase (GPIT) subunit GPI8
VGGVADAGRIEAPVSLLQSADSDMQENAQPITRILSKIITLLLSLFDGLM